MFAKILIANRGEIACRVMRTARKLGATTVAVYSDADRDALHVREADEAYRLGPAAASESYLRADRVIDIARRSGASAVHPGYGFLSENADFAEACDAADIAFIGPPAAAIRAMGLKDAAKRLMEEAGVPVVPGYHGTDQSDAVLREAAESIGFPVMIKATAGGGGKGMRRVDALADFDDALSSARREAKASFGDDRVIVERALIAPRHIEIQIFADAHGNVIHLFERDCSLQRRHQKVLEEAPAPQMSEAMREAMGAAAVAAARAIDYRGAGTVEFIADASEGLRPDRFYFMEMNTRLQVEHPVTEMITGQDLVEWQLRAANGETLPLAQSDLAIDGHAIEVRLYAEDASRGFLPATGRLRHLDLPVASDGVRIDAGVRQGDTITPHYDPMIAKIIAHAQTREAALDRLSRALGAVEVAGCVTNAAFLGRLVEHAEVRSGEVETGLIDRALDELTEAEPVTVQALIAAAMHGAGALDEPADQDPWSTHTGWRLWGGGQTHVRLALDDDVVDVAVSFLGEGRCRVELRDDSHEVGVMEHDADAFVFDAGDAVFRASVLEVEGGLQLVHQGRTYFIGLPDFEEVADDALGADDHVAAPLPGRIASVHVATGDAVAKGDALVIMDAMKMETTIAAPRDGVVAEVGVVCDEQVLEGAVLVTLEPLAES